MPNDESYFYVEGSDTKYAFNDADAEQAIATEISRAEAADLANATAISNEVVRAGNVEGNLASLRTSAKGSLVAAINEVDVNADNALAVKNGFMSETVTLGSATRACFGFCASTTVVHLFVTLEKRLLPDRTYNFSSIDVTYWSLRSINGLLGGWSSPTITGEAYRGTLHLVVTNGATITNATANTPINGSILCSMTVTVSGGGTIPDVVDPVKPKYVAFGPSTTAGQYPRFTGQSVVTSIYAYPDYVGAALGMDAVNLGIGGTGFLARNGGNYENFCDRVYSHDSDLQDAKLVTFVFGYGNDKSAGLPIGRYDDYYPYDAAGYHPSGAAGITTMLSKGATLMGLLNWCIKWINEKYPRAQVIPVMGAPSINKGRAVTQTANPSGEGAGQPPYKLTFAAQYDDPDDGDYGQLSSEFDKLLAALGLAGVNLIREGANFTWWQSYARDADGMYSIFATTGTAGDQSTWTWNSHPNDDGYHAYGRFIAGKIVALFNNAKDSRIDSTTEIEPFSSMTTGFSVRSGKCYRQENRVFGDIVVASSSALTTAQVTVGTLTYLPIDSINSFCGFGGEWSIINMGYLFVNSASGALAVRDTSGGSSFIKIHLDYITA